MRPIRAFAALLSLFTLAAPAAAQEPQTSAEPKEAAAAKPAAPVTAAAQALPLAEPPEAKLVPATPAPREPVPTVQRMLQVAELLAAPADVPDDPAVADEIDSESAEMEDLRRAEEESHVADRAPVAPHTPGEGRIALLPELDHDLKSLQAEYDIPIEVNEAVRDYVRFFQSKAGRKHFVKWLGRSHKYMDRYRAIMRQEGIPEDTVFLAMIESGFANYAYSRARASGPWQFIAGTGKLFGLKQDFWVDERRDPERSAYAAARYLKLLHQQTGDWRLAWAGYNAGVGRIFKAKAKGYEDFWEMAAVKGRKVLRAETKGYVPKLMAAAIITKHPEAFGFRKDEIEPQAWTEYVEVTIPSATLLGVVARASGVAERDLMDLNPELRRSCTPPRPYKIKLPKESEATFAQAWPAVQGKVKMTFAGHVVRRGDTLSSIAHHYGVPVEGILEMNGLRTAKKLRVGQELIIPKPLGAGTVARAEPASSSTPSKLAKLDEPAGEEPRRASHGRQPTATLVASHATERAGASKTTLRVQQGDTLWSIARRLGVELSELCRWNGISNPRRHKLLVGAQLVVYAERG
jgi:membrane-bound lytic murein transglycosylase D